MSITSFAFFLSSKRLPGYLLTSISDVAPLLFPSALRYTVFPLVGWFAYLLKSITYLITDILKNRSISWSLFWNQDKQNKNLCVKSTHRLFFFFFYSYFSSRVWPFGSVLKVRTLLWYIVTVLNLNFPNSLPSFIRDIK